MNSKDPSKAEASATAHPTTSSMIKTKAAVAWRPNEPLSIETVDLMRPRTDEVMIRLEAAALCHTDAYTLSGKDPEGIFPVILGHEGGGVVVEIGEESETLLQVGDHVIPLYTPECGECKFCKSQKTNLCQAIRSTQGKGVMPDSTTRFFKDGKPIYHYMGTSCFSEFIVVPKIAVAKVSRAAPLREICLLGCGVTTGMGAVQNTAKIESGSNVAIFGLGTVGLSAIMAAKMAQAKIIIAIDIDNQKFDLARRFGATHCINPKEIGRIERGEVEGETSTATGSASGSPTHPPLSSIVDEIIRITDGGADYSFECIGNVQVMRQALECCHKGWGQSIIIGVAGAGEEISTRPFQLVTGRVWKGSAFGGVKGRSQLPKLVDQYLAGDFDLKPFITQVMPIEQINHALTLLHEGKSLRTVLTFT